MAKDNFGKYLTDPKKHSSTNKQEGKKGVAGRDRSKAHMVSIVISLSALALGGLLTYFLIQLHARQQLLGEAFQAHAHQYQQSVELINKRLDTSSNQIATLESQIQVTMERVGVTQQELKKARALAEQLREEQVKQVATLSQEIQQKANVEKVSRLEEESGQKFEHVDEEITLVKQEVTTTKQDLVGTMAKLASLGVKVNEQGQMIATTRDGLQELKVRGERDYFEFELRKKQKASVAGITLELRDTDLGKESDADIRIFANDTMMEKKDLHLNVPVNFYVYSGGEKLRYELVVNEVFDRRCMGYVSVPKGKVDRNLVVSMK